MAVGLFAEETITMASRKLVPEFAVAVIVTTPLFIPEAGLTVSQVWLEVITQLTEDAIENVSDVAAAFKMIFAFETVISFVCNASCNAGFLRA